MNRSRQPLTNRNQKKVKKEVRSSLKTKLSKKEEEESDVLTARELLKKFPKPTENLKKQLQKIKKKFPKKSKKKVSKRTAPGPAVPADSTPAYPHREGGRWLKTRNAQTASQKTVSTRQALKRKS